MNAKHVRMIVATIFAVAVTIAAFTMLNAGKMQDWTFAVTLGFSLASFAFISSIGDLLILRFWNLEVKFREVQRVEESVKVLSAAILKVFEATEHSIMQESYDADAASAAMDKLKRLIS